MTKQTSILNQISSQGSFSRSSSGSSSGSGVPTPASSVDSIDEETLATVKTPRSQVPLQLRKMSRDAKTPSASPAPQPRVSCEHCSETFSTRKSLLRHIRNGQQPRFLCKHCKQDFSRADYVPTHIRVACRAVHKVNSTPRLRVESSRDQTEAQPHRRWGCSPLTGRASIRHISFLSLGEFRPGSNVVRKVIVPPSHLQEGSCKNSWKSKRHAQLT